MFSLWSKVKTNIIAFLAVLLPIVAAFFYVSGRRGGREAAEAEQNREVLDDVYVAKKARESVEARDRDELRDSANRWVRSDSE